jgi:MSHA pilin protein MshC
MQYHSRGFSLIELIAVIVILGALSVGVAIRFGDTNAASVQSGRDTLVAALFAAQQIAMARADDSSNPITVVVDTGSVSVNENGSPLNIHGEAYPQNFPTGVQVSSGTGTYQLDKLGRTTAASITLIRGSVSTTINLEASGYAHW